MRFVRERSFSPRKADSLRPAFTLWVVAIPIFVFLLLPSLIVVPMSLTPSNFLEFPPSGISLHTFGDFFGDESWRRSVYSSFVVASIASAVALPVATLAALALWDNRLPGRGIITGVILMPIVIPLVVLALADFAFLAKYQLVGTRLGIALAHSVVVMPYVFVVVAASLAGLNPELIRAARSLGSNHVSVFWHVLLPVLRSGLVAGGVFAFAISFDETVIAYFLQGPDATTLPVKMFTEIQFDLTPTIAAASTIMLLVTTLLLILQIVLMARRSRVALVIQGSHGPKELE